MLWRVPFIWFRSISTVILRVGCKGGPIVHPGCIVTKLIPFSSANFQAASSANVFERAYQRWKEQKVNQINPWRIKLVENFKTTQVFCFLRIIQDKKLANRKGNKDYRIRWSSVCDTRDRWSPGSRTVALTVWSKSLTSHEAI